MPLVTVPIDVPTNCQADLLAAANAMFASRRIDVSAMTNMQKFRLYVSLILRDVVVSQRRGGAAVTAQTAVDAAVATATTDSGGII